MVSIRAWAEEVLRSAVVDEETLVRAAQQVDDFERRGFSANPKSVRRLIILRRSELEPAKLSAITDTGSACGDDA